MPVVLTVGVNSWATVAQADTYFDSKYGTSAWATIVDDDKKRLLITGHNWILQQNVFDISPTDQSETVRQAQYESAWFVYKWFLDYEKHRALSESGVKSWRALDVSETIDKVEFPGFIAQLLLDFKTDIQDAIPTIHRDLEDNRVT